MLQTSGHHLPYLCFENHNYQFSNACDKDGTMVFLCNMARNPNGNNEWIHNTSAWYRSKAEQAKTKPGLNNLNIEDFRCTARLLVVVNKSNNRDFAFLAQPHECGCIGNAASTAAAGGEGGGIVAQETADAHAVADVGGGDEIVVADGDNAAAAQDPLAPALPNVKDNDNDVGLGEDGYSYDHNHNEQEETASQVGGEDYDLIAEISKLATGTLEALKSIWDTRDIPSDERMLRKVQLGLDVSKVFDSTVAREELEPYNLLLDAEELGDDDENRSGGGGGGEMLDAPMTNNDDKGDEDGNHSGGGELLDPPTTNNDDKGDEDGNHSGGGGGGDGGGELLDPPTTNNDDKGDDDEETGTIAATPTPSRSATYPPSYKMTTVSKSSESDDDDEGFCLNKYKDEEKLKVRLHLRFSGSDVEEEEE